MKKQIVLLLAVLLSVLPAVQPVLAAPPSQPETSSLLVYTSMRRSLMDKLIAAFTAKRPDMRVICQTAGAGTLMSKIAAERANGKIMADILWTSEVTDFYALRTDGLLAPYISPETAHILNPMPDYDGSFTPIRLGTQGLVWNTRFLQKPPQRWEDLLAAPCKDAFTMADPRFSGTAFMAAAVLSERFGMDYFRKLRANGARLSAGSEQVVDETASGDSTVCLAVDYITFGKIARGANLAISYPPEMLVIPSPAAIIKSTEKMVAAQSFMDFLLSAEGQTVLAHEGTLPVRKGITVPEVFNIPPLEETLSRAIPVDYEKIIRNKQAILNSFTEIFGED